MHRESSQLNIGKYIMHKSELLGRGATGLVFKGFNTLTNAAVAIKDIDLATINDQATKSLLANQQKALRLLNHTNVLKLQEILTVSGHLYIVTELLEGGTLQQMLAKRGPLPEDEAMSLFRQILAGQDAIIRANVIHRDLKPANILLSSANIPKIIDFGYCEVIMGGGIVRAFNVGSPAYMAPQALLKTLYSQKSDSWSLGVILYEMIHGCTPDKGSNIKQFLQQIRMSPQLIESSIRPGLDKNVHEILLKSLQYNTAQRISVAGMKYLADVYCMHKNTNRQPFAALSISNRQNSIANGTETIKQEFKSIFNQIPNKRTENCRMRQNIQNLIIRPNLPKEDFSESYRLNSAQSNQGFNPGFISYLQFRQAVEPKTVQNKSYANPIQTSQGEHHNGNQYSRISHTTTRGSSCLRDRSDKICQNANNYWQNVSGKNLMERPPMAPAFRQVKVRYL